MKLIFIEIRLIKLNIYNYLIWKTKKLEKKEEKKYYQEPNLKINNNKTQPLTEKYSKIVRFQKNYRDSID